MAIRHDFICNCGHLLENVLVQDPDRDAPKHCGRSMEISYQKLELATSVFTPFVTRNIHPDGQPLLVRNRGDLQTYYRQYGVVHVDDPNLVAEGSEIRRKAPKMPSTFIDLGRRR